MSDPLYKREILRLAADADGAGELSGPHAYGAAHNPACGDKVEFDILTDASGHLTALAHRTKACVLAQASAAILGREAAGLTRADVENLHVEVTAMLSDPVKLPAPPFEAYAAFEGATAFRNRHKCVLLPIEALLAAFEAGQE
ncbi:MAG: iron-sulfur cluster assembly scaffold protein [Alphaproteobacteria bacterium]|nr:iron-sulfur cluster assembly scaffold protein [Alphaproteobacteria bacterium]MBU6471915.1 iron-sulfur cluster assembly scaffold protein [Alphaproteobacteria bacterium]MDE2012687.1 iron-sulfur cluster assembly scaffold protein [Alphaproteobacteria bacterium]MDE2072011.1 iron-sulfur cluster assembly scaffold protein [Alphaproteobacteria bacterium]MDE2350873.1 iron-sulfur cluster assembly scaffold protein [Alphaproteobacteria bacterium]